MNSTQGWDLSKLEALRTELAQVQDELYQLIRRRAELVTKIQAQKQQSYDPKQESKVFDHPSLKEFSPKELLAISLLIEAHAGEQYPSFSEQIHLEEKQESLLAQINPLLLQKIFPIQAKKFPLKSKYFNL